VYEYVLQRGVELKDVITAQRYRFHLDFRMVNDMSASYGQLGHVGQVWRANAL
jgi:hypothetical protein